MNLTKPGEIDVHREENKFTFKWILSDFCCANHNPQTKLPSTKFDFKLGSTYSHCYGYLSLLGDTCELRKLSFQVRSSSTHSLTTTIRYGSNKYITEHCCVPDRKGTRHDIALYKTDEGCLLPGENNTIIWEIYHEWYISTPRPEVPVIKSEFFDNFAELFESKKFSDVTLYVGGKEFYAHKIILTTRCYIFEVMFEHQMKETKSNKVSIKDMEPEVFKEFLRFIYTDNVSSLKGIAIKLLAASVKYDLERLRYLCERELADIISIENAAEILIAADLHNSFILQKIAKGFIGRNKVAVAKTKGWQDILEKHFDLIIDLYISNCN